MEELIKYLGKELERAKSIYEPLQEKLDNEDWLDEVEIENLNYYEGYSDGIRASLNKIFLIEQENKKNGI